MQESAKQIASFLSDGTELYAEDDSWQRLAATNIELLETNQLVAEMPNAGSSIDTLNENPETGKPKRERKKLKQAIECAEAARNEMYILWSLMSKLETREEFTIESVPVVKEYSETIQETKQEKILEEGRLRGRFSYCLKILEDLSRNLRDKCKCATKFHSQIIRLSHFWKVKNYSKGSEENFVVVLSLEEVFHKSLVPKPKERTVSLLRGVFGDVEIYVKNNNDYSDSISSLEEFSDDDYIIISGIKNVHKKLLKMQEEMKWELCESMMHYLSLRLSSGTERTSIHKVIVSDERNWTISALRAYLMQNFLSYCFQEPVTVRPHCKAYLRFFKGAVKRKIKYETEENKSESEIIERLAEKHRNELDTEDERFEDDVQKDIAIFDLYSDSLSFGRSSEKEFNEIFQDMDDKEISKEKGEIEELSDSNYSISEFSENQAKASQYFFGSRKEVRDPSLGRENKNTDYESSDSDAAEPLQTYDEYILENFEKFYKNGNILIPDNVTFEKNDCLQIDEDKYIKENKIFSIPQYLLQSEFDVSERTKGLETSNQELVYKTKQEKYQYIPAISVEVYKNFVEAVKHEFGTRRPLLREIKKQLKGFSKYKVECNVADNFLNTEVNIEIKDLFYGSIKCFGYKLSISGFFFDSNSDKYCNLPKLELSLGQFKYFFQEFCTKLKNCPKL